ncbi:phosphocarrier protein HPr [Bordetella holmesii CDC-H643-BH]|uniref:Phosphocarrier protein HPr n=3 Tax=Bordetella TaxID=517 RepID=A0A158M418_9BORD|nr:phosphocarrier protein HPr [Bordetella holmesii CDC-H809-BH]KAK81732.1 phosphocarrier protein HPr [Bordetella holmesii CDC-H572-BH]KAK89185.1 phosphocarrier protein HPr [Bordetella holmesii CDC-H585-BH]KCV00854.1 phosphocarrier protein HPr [Bordetella holmesii CDC-H719-BH]KCV07332.1 phosphocarrier protein HPr [Bordetella holmesii CDC-H629-BH]KCV08483.1 phosphocarrier protein HPr [Bordetella holmesii 04P3421]KCV09044.1 phosphocarrier protein HPr [Bordetella holmesii CDC-H785-BH]KCV15886.1 
MIKKQNMPTLDIVISNKLGLHARAAAKLTQLASKFNSEIFIARGAQRVNAKSIMGVMMLAAGLGVTVKIDASGADADQALAEIQSLFDNKFGEQE